MEGSTQSLLFRENDPVKKNRGSSSTPFSEKRTSPRSQPLAARFRPQKREAIVGQDHLLKEDGLLPKLMKNRTLGSLFLYGPPGCGKTTLAEVIAKEMNCHCVRINAVLSNVSELREVLRLARSCTDEGVLLFIDEIHRFNKAQQDLLLPDVESGALKLIGATTHNPGFYIIPPLLSRSHLFRLNPITEDDITTVLKRALKDDSCGLGKQKVSADLIVLNQIARLSGGDLRRALNALETIVLSLPQGGTLTETIVEAFAHERQIRYDRNEDEHYDTASAFIKSMRGGDPDAALYWLAKMLLGGEDPRFIARRMVIFASEDIGLADSHALPLATATFQACEWIGLPECELNLAHTVVYLATAPKSNSTTLALSRAKRSWLDEPPQSVPLWLKDCHTKTNQRLGQGRGYRYSHDYPEGISGQEFMEQPLSIYQPKMQGDESVIAERMTHWKALKKKLQEAILPKSSSSQ